MEEQRQEEKKAKRKLSAPPSAFSESAIADLREVLGGLKNLEGFLSRDPDWDGLENADDKVLFFYLLSCGIIRDRLRSLNREELVRICYFMNLHCQPAIRHPPLLPPLKNLVVKYLEEVATEEGSSSSFELLPDGDEDTMPNGEYQAIRLASSDLLAVKEARPWRTHKRCRRQEVGYFC